MDGGKKICLEIQSPLVTVYLRNMLKHNSVEKKGWDDRYDGCDDLLYHLIDTGLADAYVMTDQLSNDNSDLETGLGAVDNVIFFRLSKLCNIDTCSNVTAQR